MDARIRKQSLEVMNQLEAKPLDKQREAWAASGIVGSSELDQIMDEVVRVNATRLVTVSAAQVFWSRGICDRVKFFTVLRQLNDLPTAPEASIVRDTTADLIRLGRVPANFAAMQNCAPVGSGQPVGQTLVQMGAATQADVLEALSKQAQIEKEARTRLRLGQLMRSLGIITWGEFVQAMAFHNGVPFSDFDDVLERLAGLEASALPFFPALLINVGGGSP